MMRAVDGTLGIAEKSFRRVCGRQPPGLLAARNGLVFRAHGQNIRAARWYCQVHNRQM